MRNYPKERRLYEAGHYSISQGDVVGTRGIRTFFSDATPISTAISRGLSYGVTMSCDSVFLFIYRAFRVG